jgi:hypothetical protein
MRYSSEILVDFHRTARYHPRRRNSKIAEVWSLAGPMYVDRLRSYKCWIFFFLWRNSPLSGLDLPIGFRNLFTTHTVGLLGWVISSSQDLYLRKTIQGRAITQAVSRRLPTAASRVQTGVWSCGILWWTKVALGQVFSENFGFPYQSTFHLPLHNHLHYHPRVAQ